MAKNKLQTGGTIGVTTENIFPVIKKFLYSDHEIFLRELVSNAVDATQKMKAIASKGEYKGELGDITIRVALDKEAKTLTVSDSGVGMTAGEIDRYINQIAFSSAGEFMEKYKDQAIIGHFGLGFYSAFMVADKVELRTQSHDESAPTMLWSCEGTPEYTLEESAEKRARGTDIVMHIAEDSVEFLESARIEGLLRKYCSFLPVPIAFGKRQEWKEDKMVDTDEDNIINDTNPLWTRKPADITPEEYDEFYRRLYPTADDPLFHIHLNIDYPFNLTGILYFPKIRNNFEIQKNRIQLYSNQVYVTDSVEGIVPEFLTLLHGVIDSPDIPLNVSRSYLQSDSNVRKISSYITRKVADRLQELFNESRAGFEAKWDDLKIFIEYGLVSDEKFAEKAAEFFLLKNTDGKYFTLKEYEELIKGEQTDKHGTLVYLYARDLSAQYTFIDNARAKGYDVLLMDGQLDNHFINWFEQKHAQTRFVRVDSDVAEKLIEKDHEYKMALSSTQQDILRPVFESHLPESGEKAHYRVEFEAMGEGDAPVVITQNEYMRRMKDIASMGGNEGMARFYGQMPDSYTVAVNGNHPLVATILEEVEKDYGSELSQTGEKIDAASRERDELLGVLNKKSEAELTQAEKDSREDAEKKLSSLREGRDAKLREISRGKAVVKQLVDLALLSNGMLSGASLNDFIRRSVDLIGKE